MPAKKRLTMRQLRTLLRLKHGGARLSERTIACQIGVARSTIQEYLARVEAVLAAARGPDRRGRLLFPRSGCRPGFRRRVEPDWAMVAREVKRPGVTLMTLWEEYRESEPEGYGYSRFCDLFRSFERHLSPVMRQHHVAGDKVFVDFSGKRLEVIDPTSGMVRPAEIFVGVLGASSDTYAEAVWTQTLPDWAAGLDWRPQPHVRLFRRGAAAGHPGQSEVGRAAGELLRSRAEPELRPDGRALRGRHSAGPAAEAEGQGEGRGRRPGRSAVAAGPVAAADLLLAGGVQPGDRHRPGAAQRQAAAPAGSEPTRAVRPARPAGPESIARGAVRVCRMAAGAGRAITSRSRERPTRCR